MKIFLNILTTRKTIYLHMIMQDLIHITMYLQSIPTRNKTNPKRWIMFIKSIMEKRHILLAIGKIKMLLTIYMMVSRINRKTSIWLVNMTNLMVMTLNSGDIISNIGMNKKRLRITYNTQVMMILIQIQEINGLKFKIM